MTVVVVEERDLSTFVDRTWRMHDLCRESQTDSGGKSLVIYLWFRHDARLPCCIVKSGLVWSDFSRNSMSNGAQYKSQSILKSLMLLRSKLSVSAFYKFTLFYFLFFLKALNDLKITALYS